MVALGRLRGRRSAVAAVAFFVAFATVVGPFGMIDVAIAQVQPVAAASQSELIAALDSGAPTIELASMSFNGTPVVIGRDVTLVGTGPSAEDTTITVAKTSGSVPGQAFVVTGGNVAFENLAITGADTRTKGGAIEVQAGASVTLRDVYLHGNQADEGGAVFNAGSTTVVGSTFASNSSSRKGAGIESDGDLTVVNSTFTNNIGKGGGAISVAGTANLSFVTVVSNTSTNKIGAGILRNGGTVTVKNSIVANNVDQSGDFHDCSGSPDFRSVLLSSDQGCNPTGSFLVVPLVMFGALDYYGGSTPTLSLLDSTSGALHPAVDLAVDCRDLSGTAVTVDQRGVSRPQPQDPGECDAGAYERSQLPPRLNLTTSPPPNEAGWNNTGVTVEIAPIDPVKTITYAYGAIEDTYSSPFVVSAEGLTTVSYQAEDYDGNTASGTVDLQIDLTAPTIEASQGSVTSDGTIVTLSATDDTSGVSEIKYSIAGEDFSVSGPSVDIPVNATGDTIITYSAIDVAGNESTQQTLTVSIDPLTLVISMETSASEVEVGAVTVPLENLPAAGSAADAAGTTNSAQLSAIQLSAIQLSAIQLSAIQLSAIATEAAQLSAIQLSAIAPEAAQLSAILTQPLQLSAIQLSAINLSEIQLSAIGSYPEGTEVDDLLCDDVSGVTVYCGTPLQALTLFELIEAEPQITLADIDFRSTQLSAIQLSAILVVQLPLEVLIEDKAEWCSALNLDATECSALDTSDSLLDLANDPAYADDRLTLNSAQLSAIQLSAIQLSAIGDWWGSLTAAQLSAIQLSAIQLSAIDWSSTQLSAIQLSAIQLSAIDWLSAQLSAIQLSAIDWSSTQLSAIQLSAIQLSAIGCTSTTVCVEGVTLGELDAAGLLSPTLTLSDLASEGVLDEATLGQLEAIGVLDNPDLTIADLIELFTYEPLASSGYSLADLLLALVPPTDISWEDLGSSLASLPLADAADNTGTSRTSSGIKQPTFDFVITLDIAGPQSFVDVGLALPAGFTFARPDGTVADDGVPLVRLNEGPDASLVPIALDPTASCLDPSPVAENGSYLVFEDLVLSEGSNTLKVPVWAGTTLGTFSGVVDACADAGTQQATAFPDSASITVIEGSPASTTIDPGDLELAHIATEGEIRQYTFTLESRAQARIILNSFGEVDLDLVLFGPPLQDFLRGEPQTGFGLVEDFTYDLTPDNEVLDPNTLNDIPLDPPDANSVVHAVAATRGGDEVIDTGALRPGTYTIQVSGYNGATDLDAFALRLRTTPLESYTCQSGLSFSASGSPATPSGINTVFLYNATTYGDTGALLGLLADDRWEAQGISGAAVAIDSYQPVATALNGWAGNYCDPLAANDVVRAIGEHILDPIIADPTNDLQYVVIIGGDEQVPFARNTDGTFVSNEAVHGLTLDGLDATKASLVEGYYLTDTPYGGVGYRIADREFFIPNLAIGRLVEDLGSPGIESTIEAYLDNNGYLTDLTSGANGNAIVAGYDFLLDGAAGARDALSSDFNVIDSSGGAPLLGETWSAADLAAIINTPASLAVIEAHYDESRLLPADENLNGTENVLFTVEQYLTMENRAFFVATPGCHSGLSIAQMLNWADSNALAGNTGYGYGDSEIVALSERLVELTAERIGTQPVGVAIRNAVNAYVQELYVLTPYDLKVMEEFTLYGLPMARTVGVSAVASTSAFAASTAPANQEPAIFNDPFTGLPSSITSLDYSELASTVPATPEGWKGADYGLMSARGHAVLPTDTIEVSSTGRLAAGVLITGLSSPAKDTSFVPLISDPQAGEQYTPGGTTADSRLVPGESTFPASVQSPVKHVLGDDGNWHDRVVIVPARHYTEKGIDELEVFTDVEIQTLYRPDGWDENNVAEAPFIQRSIGRSDSNGLEFEITVRAPANGTTERVLVIYREDGAIGPWQSVELASPDGVRWIGSRPVGSQNGFEFIVQAVGSAGDVASATGKAINFDTISANLEQGVTVTVSDSGTPAFGWYPRRAGADVVALAEGAGLCEYRLDGQQVTLPGGDSATIDIEGDGKHTLAVYGGPGCTDVGVLTVSIDGTAPETSGSVDRTSGSSVLILAASDQGVGVARIAYRIGDGVFQPYDGPVDLDLTATTVIEFFSTDYLDNDETTQTITVDLTPPSVTATGTATRGTSTETYSSGEWTNADSVVVTLASSDTDLAHVDFSYGALSDSGASGLTTDPISTEGSTTVTYSATDTSGNSSPDSTFVVKIDKAPPTATLTLPEFAIDATEGSYTCDDTLSGMATCIVEINGTTVAGDAEGDDPAGGTFTLPGGSIGGVLDVSVTAMDQAGNSFSVSGTYGKNYGYCYLYDPDKTTSGAVAIKIEVTTDTWDVRCDGTETNISGNNLTVYAYLLDGRAATPQDSGKANSDPTLEFRYDRKLGGYIYNLNDTISDGLHVLTFTIGQNPLDTVTYPNGNGLITYSARFVYKN